MARVFVGLGSNVGDRRCLLQQAIEHIGTLAGCHLVQESPVYETSPVSDIPQGDFLNQVAELSVTHEPELLVRAFQDIENALGRIHDVRNGPRAIDIDLLLYDERIVRSGMVVVPHPRLHERLFVLVPLCDIAPHVIHPVLRQSMALLCEHVRHRVGDHQCVRKYVV